MAKILLTWELGGDYGHLSKLIPVALQLARQGHEPIFAIREMLGAETLLADHGFRWFQAPLWLAQTTNLPPPFGYPEMLMRFGFLNGRALTGICRAWRNLIDLIRPDLLVLEHSPTALLATRGLGIPRLLLGSGFSLPPATDPLPRFAWWHDDNPIRRRDSENQALIAANTVTRTFATEPLTALRELFEAERQVLCTFPELDHYPERLSIEWTGPIFSLGTGTPAEWPGAPELPRVFVYLKPGFPKLDAVLQALSRLPVSVLAHIPHAARKCVSDFRSDRMTVTLEPIDIESARFACDLAICHGGAGTTAAMLLAGKPLLMLPTQMEQLMACRKIEQLGAGQVLPSDADPGEVIQACLRNPTLKARAREFSAKYANYVQHESVQYIVTVAERLLRV